MQIKRTLYIAQGGLLFLSMSIYVANFRSWLKILHLERFCKKKIGNQGYGPHLLILNAPNTTKVVCLSRLPKCVRSLYGKSVDPDQTAPIAVCSWSTLVASILNSSVMLCNYLQQKTSADDIFRCFYFLGALRVKWLVSTNSASMLCASLQPGN